MTQSELRLALNYNPETGVFINLKRRGKVLRGAVLGHSNGPRGYLRIDLCKRKWLLHRLAFFYMTGRYPVEIDHINHDTLDNRWCNLREVTHLLNTRNQKLHKRNTSGVAGLSKRGSKWRVYIGDHVWVGSFDTREMAIKARKQAEIALGYHPNHGKVSVFTGL